MDQTTKERNRCLAAVDAEPEYPGNMPNDMWEAIRNDREATEQVFRITVSLTKRGIRDRILSNKIVINPTNGVDQQKEQK